jgi:hypothetical protein
VKNAKALKDKRRKLKEAGLCSRCPARRRNPLRFGLDRCLECLFKDGTDQDWLDDFPALIAELRKIAAEPVPKHVKKVKSAKDTGIADEDLLPHWRSLKKAVR